MGALMEVWKMGALMEVWVCEDGLAEINGLGFGDLYCEGFNLHLDSSIDHSQ